MRTIKTLIKTAKQTLKDRYPVILTTGAICLGVVYWAYKSRDNKGVVVVERK